MRSLTNPSWVEDVIRRIELLFSMQDALVSVPSTGETRARVHTRDPSTS